MSTIRTEAVLAAFPRRALHLLVPELRKPYVIIGSLIVILALFGAWLPFGIQSLREDIKISQNYVVDEQANIKGSCHRKAFLAICSMQISYQDANRSGLQETSRHIVIFDIAAEHSVYVVRAKDEPNLVTSNLAIETIDNRIILMGVCVVLMILFLYFGSINFVTHRKLWKIIDSKKELQAEPKIVDIYSNGMIYKYGYEAMQDGKRIKGPLLSVKTKPFYLDRDQKTALAVRLPGLSSLIVLDEDLRYFDFTGEERQALRATRDFQPEESISKAGKKSFGKVWKIALLVIFIGVATGIGFYVHDESKNRNALDHNAIHDAALHPAAGNIFMVKKHLANVPVNAQSISSLDEYTLMRIDKVEGGKITARLHHSKSNDPLAPFNNSISGYEENDFLPEPITLMHTSSQYDEGFDIVTNKPEKKANDDMSHTDYVIVRIIRTND